MTIGGLPGSLLAPLGPESAIEAISGDDNKVRGTVIGLLNMLGFGTNTRDDESPSAPPGPSTPTKTGPAAPGSGNPFLKTAPSSAPAGNPFLRAVPSAGPRANPFLAPPGGKPTSPQVAPQSTDEIASALRRAGFPEQQIPAWVQVVLKESSGRPDATNDTRGTTPAQRRAMFGVDADEEWSVGPFQINMLAHGGSI